MSKTAKSASKFKRKNKILRKTKGTNNDQILPTFQKPLVSVIGKKLLNKASADKGIIGRKKKKERKKEKKEEELYESSPPRLCTRRLSWRFEIALDFPRLREALLELSR